MSGSLINLIYLIAGILFILGIKGLTKPKTAVRGNFLSALGMLIAVVVTLFTINDVDFTYVLAGVGVGGIVGVVMALRIQMTSMPQMVALLNGFGGGASLSIALAEYVTRTGINPASISDFLQPTAVAASAFGKGAEATIALMSISLTVLIGAVTLTGSLVAFSKLQELMKKSYGLPGGPVGNGILLLGALAAVAFLVMNPGNTMAMVAILGLALLLGLFLVMPIGGADMPVVIALLNSYSGIAAALAGFILGNTVLIIAGSLVGTSGLILTRIMCVAMNRSLANVLFGKMAAGGETIDADEIYDGKVTSAQPDEVAMLLETAQRVVIVPGYGMAMAQAQHAVREVAELLESKGKKVLYAIHPVAGRMPGHMNVLLAEANIPYEQLKDLDEINPEFEDCDVALVLGANDVVNPAARHDTSSPIYGMPILDVDKSRTVIINKRTMNTGFAGIQNELFGFDNSIMVFGDAKDMLQQLLKDLKEL